MIQSTRDSDASNFKLTNNPSHVVNLLTLELVLVDIVPWETARIVTCPNVDQQARVLAPRSQLLDDGEVAGLNRQVQQGAAIV